MNTVLHLHIRPFMSFYKGTWGWKYNNLDEVVLNNRISNPTYEVYSLLAILEG